jgi:Flp pilus assembly protein TadD
VLIGAGAIVVYAGTFHAPFVYDDLPSLLGNPSLHSLWPLSGPLHPPPGAMTVSGRPLLNLSFAVNYAIGGEKVWSYHAVNLVIHILAGCTLYGLIARSISRPFAAVAALLWTLHPLQTESVTYVVQRAESLVGLCYLFTLYAFVRSLSGNRRTWQFLSVLSCWLGTGVKEVIVTAPVLVLLLDWVSCQGPRTIAPALRTRRVYYLALFASWLPLLYLTLANGANRGGSAGFGLRSTAAAATALHYWLTQCEAVLRYVSLALWPHPLVFLYGPLPPRPWLLSAACVAVLCVAFVAAVVATYRRKPAGFLGLSFFLLLAPTSVIPGTMQEVVEHRMYLPLACVIIALLYPCWRAWSSLRWVGPLAACAVILGAGAVTFARNAEYRSALTLWAGNVARRPGCAQAESSYGAALAAAGRPAEASLHYERALALSPPAIRHTDLGLAYDQAGQPQAALDEYLQALQFNPHLGFAEINAGRALFRLGRLEEAQRRLRAGISDSAQIGTEAASAELLLGVCLGQLGRPAEAVAEFRQAIALNPSSAEAHYDLGNALSGLGNLAAARAEFAKALVIRPAFPEAQAMLQRTAPP